MAKSKNALPQRKGQPPGSAVDAQVEQLTGMLEETLPRIFSGILRYGGGLVALVTIAIYFLKMPVSVAVFSPVALGLAFLVGRHGSLKHAGSLSRQVIEQGEEAFKRLKEAQAQYNEQVAAMREEIVRLRESHRAELARVTKERATAGDRATKLATELEGKRRELQELLARIQTLEAGEQEVARLRTQIENEFQLASEARKDAAQERADAQSFLAEAAARADEVTALNLSIAELHAQICACNTELTNAQGALARAHEEHRRQIAEMQQALDDARGVQAGFDVMVADVSRADTQVREASAARLQMLEQLRRMVLLLETALQVPTESRLSPSASESAVLSSAEALLSKLAATIAQAIDAAQNAQSAGLAAQAEALKVLQEACRIVTGQEQDCRLGVVVLSEILSTACKDTARNLELRRKAASASELAVQEVLTNLSRSLAELLGEETPTVGNSFEPGRTLKLVVGYIARLNKFQDVRTHAALERTLAEDDPSTFLTLLTELGMDWQQRTFVHPASTLVVRNALAFLPERFASLGRMLLKLEKLSTANAERMSHYNSVLRLASEVLNSNPDDRLYLALPTEARKLVLEGEFIDIPFITHLLGAAILAERDEDVFAVIDLPAFESLRAALPVQLVARVFSSLYRKLLLVPQSVEGARRKRNDLLRRCGRVLFASDELRAAISEIEQKVRNGHYGNSIKSPGQEGRELALAWQAEYADARCVVGVLQHLHPVEIFDLFGQMANEEAFRDGAGVDVLSTLAFFGEELTGMRFDPYMWIALSRLSMDYLVGNQAAGLNIWNPYMRAVLTDATRRSGLRASSAMVAEAQALGRAVNALHTALQNGMYTVGTTLQQAGVAFKG